MCLISFKTIILFAFNVFQIDHFGRKHAATKVANKRGKKKFEIE